METPNLALLVLLDAKLEYTCQLISILLPRLNEGVKSMFDTTSQLVNNEPDKILIAFQNTLSNIPNWSNETLDKEYIRIIKISKCDWLDDLISAIFICNAKILSVVRKDHTNSNHIDLNVPTGKFFIHQCYIDLARELWQNPYPIYKHHLTSFEINENQRKINEMIKSSIKMTIQRLLPTKDLLKQFLNKNIDELVSEAKQNISETLPPLKDITKELPSTQPAILETLNQTPENIHKPHQIQPQLSHQLESPVQPTIQPTSQSPVQPIVQPTIQPTSQFKPKSPIHITPQLVNLNETKHHPFIKSPLPKPSLSGGSSIHNIKVCEINLNDPGISKPNSNSDKVSDIITQLNNLNQKRNLYFK